jgi:hypothetical protein
MENCGDDQSGFEVVPSERQQRGGGTGEEQRVEARLVVLDEPVEFVRHRKHDVEIRDGQQVLGLLLQPLSTLEPLAGWTMAIAARVRHEGFLAAMGALILMATQLRRVTGGDGAKNLPVMDRQTMSLREVRQRGSHDFAQHALRALTVRLAGAAGSAPSSAARFALRPAATVDLAARATYSHLAR